MCIHTPKALHACAHLKANVSDAVISVEGDGFRFDVVAEAVVISSEHPSYTLFRQLVEPGTRRTHFILLVTDHIYPRLILVSSQDGE